ncbi:MAG: response regulator transcription factor [Verrucomicrobiae bacterium]|nr:response regulator transcription factor [Verrucomicrobiae bacterium]
MNRIKVCLVDDDPAFCETTKSVLNRDPKLSCVGTFRNGADALQGLPALRPDVVLMDIEMPRMSGIECLSRLRDRGWEASVIMLTVCDSNQKIFEALVAGATGYLLKDAATKDLTEAIQEVHGGGSPMTNQIARRVLQEFRRMGQSVLAANQLTSREEEILSWAERGLRYKEIAARLSISEHTVRNHFQRIYRKLQVGSRREAIARHRHRVGP